MSRHRFTIEELSTWSDRRILLRLVRDRLEDTTNPYSPLSRRLDEIREKLVVASDDMLK